MDCELRSFDRTLLTFSLSSENDLDVFRLLDVGPSPLWPLDLEPTDEGLDRWLSCRALPFNRRFAGALCRAMGIRPDDTARVIGAGMGLSLDDPYWVVPAGSPLRFDETNLFENGFDDHLARVALTGVAPDGPSPVPGPTPELTTGGSLAKAWAIAPDGTRELWKGSTPGYVPGEWLSECLAWQVGSAMGLDATPYRADVRDGVACSVCPNFCSRDVSYTALAPAMGRADLPHAVAFAVGMGEDQLERLADMLVLDSLLVNTDRHFTNLGVLRDMTDGSLIGLAPVFDNGRSLFPDVADVSDLGPAVACSSPATGRMTFDEQAARVMGERQLEGLAALSSFSFDPEPLGPLGRGLEGRLEALSVFVRDRSRTLSRLTPVPREGILEAASRLDDAPAPGPSVRG